MAQNDTLSPRASTRMKAATYRVAGLSQDAAAKRAGISRTSVARWERIPGDAEYWEYWEEARQQLKKATWPEAFLTLRAGLRAERDGDRIRSAEILLKMVDGEFHQSVSIDQEDRLVIIVEDEDDLPERPPLDA